MRTLLGLTVAVLLLATPTWGAGPDVTITDGSTADQPVKKINCKATVVPAGSATITRVDFEIYQGGNLVVGAGGQGNKQAGTNDWKLVSIVLPAGTYTVKSIATYNPNTQTKSKFSGNITINP
jgi:hypothetical protein